MSRKLALLWTGPYKVVKKVTDSLAKIVPFGEWAKNSCDIVTTVDVVRGPLPEEKLRPKEKLDLDEIEEDLEDYSEFIRGSVGEPQDEIDGSLQLGPGSWESRELKEEDMGKGMIGNSSGEPGEEERGAKEEAREPNDMEEMKEQIVDQCPGQIPLSRDPISPNGSASPELKRQTAPVVPSHRQREAGETVREFAEPP